MGYLGHYCSAHYFSGIVMMTLKLSNKKYKRMLQVTLL